MTDQRRRSSDGDGDYRAMQDTGGRDPADTKWSFNFRRLFAIVILTFCITIFALIYDQLSIAIKKVTDDDTGQWCKVRGECGWRVGSYKYTVSSDGYDNADCPPKSGQSTYEIDFAEWCDKSSDDYSDDCDALNAGNCWLAFSIISLISLILLLCIFVPACIKKKSMVSEKYQKNLRIILIVLFAITWICEFLAAFIWLFLSVCDEANPYYYDLITEDTANSFGVSTGCMLLCFVANLVGFGAVSCCWSDYTELSRNTPADQDL